MNTTLALRLLWKEYRMQRGLWLAMAFGCVLIQFVISVVAPKGEMALQTAVSLSLLLTFFYTMGSGAMTFAIEREEATQIRPVMMGCPPGLTLSVKLIFGFVATLLLVTATGLSGLLLTQGNLQLPPIHVRPDTPAFVLILVAAVTLPFLGALLWSMFFSLVTRTVILALGLSVIAMIFTYGVSVSVASILVDRPRAEPTAFQAALGLILPTMCTLLLLVVNYFLTYRWLTHVFFDQRTVRSPSLLRRFRLSRSSIDGGVTVEIGGEDRTTYEVLDPKMAVFEPPPRFGLSLLHSLWGPNRWRHLRFLRWKEAFETRKLFLLFFLSAGLLILASGVQNTNDGAFVVTGYSSIVCLCCGVMAFRKEQNDRLFLKLADMGLNPRTVWFSKHLVWLVRAFCCCFFLFLFAIIFGLAPPRAPDHLIAAVILGRAIIGILTLYGIGQLCSLLIRSAIVSVFVAFVVALLAFAWAMVCARLEVSWTLSVLPLAVGCFLVTWFRVRPWTLDDKRPRTWLFPLCSIVAAVAIAYTGTWLYRVYEVPWVPPLYAGSSASTLADPAVKRGPLTATEEETFSLYRRAAELLPATSDEARRTVRELIATAAASPECAEFSADDCDLLMLQDSLAPGVFIDVLREVLSAADEKIAAEDFKGALKQYEIAFAVALHSAGRGDWSSFLQCHKLTTTVLEAVQAWAAVEAVDKPLLQRAIALIDEHREKLVTPEAVNYFSSMAIRNTLDGDVLAMSQLVRGPEERMVMALSMEFPGERPRCHRVLNQIESYQNKITASYRTQLNGLRGTGRGIHGFPNLNPAKRIIAADASQQMRRWIRTTPSVSFLASASSDINCERDLHTECEVRATKVLLRLLTDRKESSEYPETLKDFDVSLNNPRTDRAFAWYPKGLDQDLIGNSGVLVAARTPFLLSANSDIHTVVVVPDPNAVIENEMGFGSMEMMGGFSEAEDVEAIPEEERPPVPTVYRLNLPHSRHGFSGPKIWTLPAAVSKE